MTPREMIAELERLGLANWNSTDWQDRSTNHKNGPGYWVIDKDDLATFEEVNDKDLPNDR